MPRSLRTWVLLILALAIVVGLGAPYALSKVVPPETRARWALKAGRPAAAERLFLESLNRGPVRVDVALEFLEAHQLALGYFAASKLMRPTPNEDPDGDEDFRLEKRRSFEAEEPLPESVVEEFVARPDLPPEVSLLVRYARVHEPDTHEKLRAEILAGAAREPPLPYTNHVLAREAEALGRPLDAADAFEREALAFGRREELMRALELRREAGDHDGLRARMNDPRFAALVPPWQELRYAVEIRDWPRALRASMRSVIPSVGRGAIVLAAISALAWFAFCARIGQLRRAPARRSVLYLAAFVLGILSIGPTHFLIETQEQILHLHETGDVVRDLAFYVLGVGFREELAKLLLFLPLVPFLRRGGDAVETVAAGALVGLGFAALENVQYFARGDLSTALARFVTANFLHMAMTAVITTSFVGIFTKKDGFHDFTVSFLKIVAMHGLYDFFIVNPHMRSVSFLSMATFVVVAREFILVIHAARLRAGRSKPLLPVFVLGLSTVGAASFVYASVLVGPALAARAMFLGLLGIAVLLIVFVRQLRAL